VTLRIDTPIEIEYYRHGGILPYMLRQLIAHASRNLKRTCRAKGLQAAV
jgi:hypothetical protein